MRYYQNGITLVFGFIASSTFLIIVQSTKEISMLKFFPMCLKRRLKPPYISLERMKWSPELKVVTNAVAAPKPDEKQRPYLASSIDANKVCKQSLVGFPCLLYSYF